MAFLSRRVRRMRGSTRRNDSAIAQTEAYRILRTNVMVALSAMAQPTVIVTSAYPNEGKTSVTANLAAALASAGYNVGLVDMDLRHPDLHRWFDGHHEAGVTDVLLRRRSLQECLQYRAVDTGLANTTGGVYLLATGLAVERPTELLSTSATAQLLQELVEYKPDQPGAQSREMDMVLVDTPPVLPVADALVIGRQVTGALLVVEAGKTAIGAVEQAKNTLTRSQTRLLGVIMNGRSSDLDSGYGYGYGYGYGDPGEGNEPGGAGRPE